MVWDSLILFFLCLYTTFICYLFFLSKASGLSVKHYLGKHWRRLGKLLSDILHVWFHFSWPNCGALGVCNHILTDLPRDTRLWASLAPAWRQIDSCSFAQAHTYLSVFRWNRAFIHCLQMECSQYYMVNLVIKLNLFLHVAWETLSHTHSHKSIRISVSHVCAYVFPTRSGCCQLLASEMFLWVEPWTNLWELVVLVWRVVSGTVVSGNVRNQDAKQTETVRLWKWYCTC